MSLNSCTMGCASDVLPVLPANSLHFDLERAEQLNAPAATFPRPILFLSYQGHPPHLKVCDNERTPPLQEGLDINLEATTKLEFLDLRSLSINWILQNTPDLLGVIHNACEEILAKPRPIIPLIPDWVAPEVAAQLDKDTTVLSKFKQPHAPVCRSEDDDRQENTKNDTLSQPSLWLFAAVKNSWTSWSIQALHNGKLNCLACFDIQTYHLRHSNGMTPFPSSTGSPEILEALCFALLRNIKLVRLEERGGQKRIYHYGEFVTSVHTVDFHLVALNETHEPCWERCVGCLIR